MGGGVGVGKHQHRQNTTQKNHTLTVSHTHSHSLGHTHTNNHARRAKLAGRHGRVSAARWGRSRATHTSELRRVGMVTGVWFCHAVPAERASLPSSRGRGRQRRRRFALERASHSVALARMLTHSLGPACVRACARARECMCVCLRLRLRRPAAGARRKCVPSGASRVSVSVGLLVGRSVAFPSRSNRETNTTRPATVRRASPETAWRERESNRAPGEIALR